MKRRHGALALQLIVCLLPVAQAAESGRGFHVTAGLGAADMDVSGRLVAIGTSAGEVFHVLPESSDVDRAELGWTAGLGYRLGPHFAAELGYVDSGELEVSEVFTTPPTQRSPGETHTLEQSVRVKGPTLSILGAVRPVPRFDVFLRLGVLFADHRIEVHPGTTAFTVDDEVWLAGIGADWLITTRWSARLEYQRADTLDETFASGASDLEQIYLSALFRL
jgi:opacity protein-like surface antigen